MTTAAPGIASPGTPDPPGLPARPRPQPPSALTASAAFGWRALLKIKHVPEQLFDVIAIPVVFTLMFTYLFGGALAGSPTPTCSSSSPARWSWPSCWSACTPG